MTRFMMTLGLAAVLGAGTASAQVNMVGGAPGPSPLGLTSPLGLGAAAPVASTGIPLGATELIPPGTSPAGLSTSDIAACSGSSGLTAVFDGGTTGTASGTCTSGATTALARPTASASSPTGMAAAAPVGRVGIPMGSTELGAGGLSPPPVAVTGSISSLLSTSSPTFGK
jgi:hypothetical protein